MKELYEKLEEFACSHIQTDYSLKGFGNFGDDVIFMDVKASREMMNAVSDLGKTLHTIQNLTFDEFDTNDGLHATVAFGSLKPFNFNEIWNYLATTSEPNFQMKLDNITVMKREKDIWEIDRIFEIKP